MPVKWQIAKMADSYGFKFVKINHFANARTLLFFSFYLRTFAAESVWVNFSEAIPIPLRCLTRVVPEEFAYIIYILKLLTKWQK